MTVLELQLVRTDRRYERVRSIGRKSKHGDATHKILAFPRTLSVCKMMTATARLL